MVDAKYSYSSNAFEKQQRVYLFLEFIWMFSHIISDLYCIWLISIFSSYSYRRVILIQPEVLLSSTLVDRGKCVLKETFQNK